jgi:hypothetical protein
VCSERPKVVAEHVSLQVPWRLSQLARADTIIVPGVDSRLEPQAQRDPNHGAHAGGALDPRNMKKFISRLSQTNESK